MLSALFYFVLVLVATIALSFLIERLLKPRAPKLTPFNILFQSLIISLAFLILSLIVQRPIFSGIAILVFLTIVVVVSNTKYHTLKEPMVFSDIAMFSQAFKHPRLYFPFLGLAPVILGPLIIIGLIVLVLSLEPALPFIWQRILATLLLIAAIIFAIKTLGTKPTLSRTPENDNQQYGLFNSLVLYALQAGSTEHKAQVKHALAQSPFNMINTASPDNNKRDNIVVVQSESFFDARRLDKRINKNVLQHFDQCCSEALQYGKLTVPAWGANTMRSEFSFLSGISCKTLDLYQFYPYQYLADLPLFTLASHLKQLGYHTVCVHPHPASFFGRDKIFPKMGFDEFVDVAQFNQKQTFGPYISDQAVTDKILEITQNKTDKPVFIFAITMENHGPLHLEKVKKEEYSNYFDAENMQYDIDKADDLIVYLRHLNNADKMIKQLTEAFNKQANSKNKHTTLCFYGDHVPSMPIVYDSVAYTDNASDYLVWSSNKHIARKAKPKSIKIETLAPTIAPSLKEKTIVLR